VKQLISIFILSCALTGYGQAIKEMKPELGYLVDKSHLGEIEFLKDREQCEEVWRKVSAQGDYEKLSGTEKEIYENCSEELENYWDILGVGCSWYCGGGQDTLSASSELKPLKGITYSVKNIHDLSYKTAWIEGVLGYGIGEFVTFHIPPQNPRITEVIVVNGYVKSDKAWRENSRVKKLKMYIDDEPFAILNLEDTKQEQHFKFNPLGYNNRDDWEKLCSEPWWTIKFEIMEVYEGEKYEDTAISEIYFDGIDVH
jgi:hypothetical protein